VKLTARIATMFGTSGARQNDAGRAAARSISRDGDGSGAPSGRRVRSLGATLALAICAFAASAAPASAATTATVDSITNVSYGSAHVTFTIHGTGQEVFWRVDYSTDEGSTWVENAAHDGPIPVTDEKTIEADITGLKGGTKYLVRVGYANESTNEAGISGEPNPDFTTLAADPPSVEQTDNASPVEYTTAEVSGKVNRPAASDDLACNFEYITDAQFTENQTNSLPGFEGASQTACAQSPVATVGSSTVTAELTGLSAGTTYHLRLAVSGPGGSDSKEAASTFTTKIPTVPTVSIEPVTVFTDATATFKGHITPGGTDPAFETSWEFICTPACPGTLSGPALAPTNSSQEVEAQATGLEPNTTYEVKLVATNSGGPATAGPQSFKTTAVGPSAETIPAFALGNGTEALLGAKVNPKNSLTEYWFEYGPGPGGPGATYPNSIPASKDASAGSGGQAIAVTQTIAGLAPGATYHFRVIAKNSLGEPKGEDLNFETALPISFPSSCANLKLRTETNSALLPECRAYEMTSEPQKNGGDASAATASSPDGNRVSYISSAAFAGAPSSNNVSNYLAERTASGWKTRSMTPPVAVENFAIGGVNTIADFNESLTKAVSITTTGALETGNHNMSQNIFLTSDDGSTQWTTKSTVGNGTVANKLYGGRSADGFHIVFESSQVFNHESDGSSGEVWEWFNGRVRLVSILPLPDGSDGLPVSTGAVVGSGFFRGDTLASGFTGTLIEPTAVSEDGRRIFFSDEVFGLYVREDGERTKNVSLSQRTGSVGQPATSYVKFAGANADGSRVYYKTETQMTDDAPVGGGLYVYDLETKKLKFVTAGLGLANASLWVKGQRTYFVASDQLIPGKGVAGANNLYMEEGEDVTFITTLGADALAGGGKEGSKPQATLDGRFFSFESAKRLTAFNNAGHTEIYLYDAAKDSLRCASCTPDGQVATGDASLAAEGALTPNFKTRGVSENGGVFFQTTDALLPADVNGRQDVYEYRDGNVALISTGTSNYPSAFWTASPDGKDVFFTTRDSLVGQDIDNGSADVYDARINGGFPAPVPPNPCEGDKCQNQAAAPPAFLGPASASNNGKGNANGRKKPNPCKHKKKKQRVKCESKNRGKKASKSGRGK
jgi:hypothetical protein